MRLEHPFQETEEDRIKQVKLQYEWTELDKNLRYLVRFIRKRLRQDWDIVVAITGEEGSGKSSFGCLFASLIDKKFNLIDNMALLPDEKQIVREYCALNKYQFYVIDEAVRAFYKMGFMTKMTQTLVKMWATERYQNKGVALIIPRFTDLVENFRNHRVKLWIHILARGVGVAYIRDDDPHNNDPWSIDYARRVKKNYAKKKNLSLLTIEERIKIEKKLPNFLFSFTFPDLDPEYKKAYNKLKVLSREDLKTGEKEKEAKEKPELTKLREQRDLAMLKMYNEKGVTIKELSKTFNIKYSTVQRAIKRAKGIKKEELKEKKEQEDNTGVHTMLDTALKIQEQAGVIKR